MDSFLCLFFIFIALFIKIFYLNEKSYERLREVHSKTYIKKNYNGFLNWLYYKDYYKEVKKLFVLNICLLILILFLIVLLFLSFFLDVTFLLYLVLGVYLLLGFAEFINTMFALVVLGKDAKGDNVETEWRLLGIVAIVLIIICVFLDR